MDLHRVILTKKKLAALPPTERSLLLLLGHVNNEINFLSKLILRARNGERGNSVVEQVETGQLFMIMRTLIEKLHEARLLFQKRFQGNRPLAEKYLPLLPPEAHDEIDKLNKHFSQGSALSDIRNCISSHYTDDDDLIEANFQRVDDTNPWEFYLSNTVVNSFYYASELVVACSIIELAKPKYGPAPAGVSPDVHALEELCKTVTTVSWLFTDLFGHLISAITRTEIPDYEFQTVKLPDGPKLSQLTLPFFVDENDVHRVPKQAA